MEVVSTDSNGIVGIYPQQPELGAAWQIHFKMACAFMSRWLVFTDPILILAMVLELEVFGLGLVEGGAEMRVWSRSVWKIGPVSEERVNSVYVMGSPLHQACWKAAGCCRGKWLPETLPSITRQVRPPNPAMRMEERRGGWGCRIRLEGTKTGKKTVEEQTINNLFLSLLDCFISFSSSAYLSLHVFLCFYFPVLHKTATRAFRNGPCWSESSPQLNCIINYSTGSGLEANLKRGREIESEQELDGEMGDSCLTPPVGLGLTLCLCLSLFLFPQMKDGRGEGLGLPQWAVVLHSWEGRWGWEGGSTSCWKEHSRLSTASELRSHDALHQACRSVTFCCAQIERGRAKQWKEKNKTTAWMVCVTACLWQRSVKSLKIS